MSGMYSKRVSTVVSTIEESSVSLSSTQTSDRNATSFRHFDISPFALRLGNDIHQWTSQTANIFKTTKSSLPTNDNQNTGNVWQHTRMSVDYNGLDKSRSSSASSSALNERERLAKSTALLKSAHSGNVHKSKPGKARKVSARKRAGKGKRSKQNSTKLTVAKVLLSHVAPIISGAISSNKTKKWVSLEKLGKQKSVGNKEKLSTNEISLRSPVKSARSNNSLFSYKTSKNSGKGNQLKASQLLIIKNNLQKSSKVSTVASKSAKIDGLECSMVFENKSSNFPSDASFRNLSTQKTSAQIEASGKVEAANNSPKLNKTVKKIKIKNKNLKQSKSNQCKKSNVVSKTYKKEISKFSSSKTVHGKTARKGVNSKNSSVSLQVHRSNFGKDKADATEISQLEKSKISKQGVIDNSHKSPVKQAGNKLRQIKTAGNSQNDKIEKISSSKFQVKNNSKKSSLSVKVGKNLTTTSANIVAEMSYTKRPRMSDSPASKEIMKPSIPRKEKSLNVVKTATKQSFIKRSNTSRQSSKPIYLSHKIANRSDKKKLLALRKSHKLAVAKKSQKQKNKQKDLRNEKHTEPTQLKKSLKEMCVCIQRKTSSLFLSPAQSASSQLFAKSLESDSSLNETTYASSTAVKKSAKKLSSSSIRKGVSKLSTMKRQKKYMTIARPSRLSEALRLKKSNESVPTYTVVQRPPIHGVTDLVQMQKSVNSPSLKRRFALTTMEKMKKSHSNIGKVTPEQSISRKKLKSSSEALSRKRLLPHATEITPKQSISKLLNISVKNVTSRTGNQTELLHFQKESTSVNRLSRNKSCVSSSCKISSHPIARLRTKSVASKPSLHVAISRSGVSTMNIAAFSGKKEVKKLSTVAQQKNSQTIAKKQTRISYNRVKGQKLLVPAAKKGTRKSLARVKQDFVHKKSMHLSKSIYSNKSTSLSNTTSLNHSNIKKSDLTSPKKMRLTESNFLMKDRYPQRTGTLNVRKYSLSVPGQPPKNASGMVRNIDCKSPWNSPIELINCKTISPKKSSIRNSKVQENKPFLPAPKKAKRTRGSYRKNNNLLCTEEKNTLKPLLVKKQLQTITSTASSNRAFAVKNTNILKLDKILSQKESLKLSAKIDAKTTQSQILRRTRPSKAYNIKTSLVFPQQKQLTKPLLDRKQLQNDNTSVSHEIVGERSEKSTKDGANEISGNKTVKVHASNTPLGIIQPSWRNITLTSPEQLMASSSQVYRRTKLPSRMSDKSNTKQTNCTTVSRWEMTETSLVRSDLRCSGLGRKSLPSSYITDPDYSQQAKHVLPELNLAISTSAIFNVVSYTGHERMSPSPISRTQVHTYTCDAGRKDRVVPSLVEKATTTLMSWTKNVRNADHHRNDASVVVSSSAILVDDYTRCRVNSSSSVETKSRFNTESDYTELCDPDMNDTSRKERSNKIEETENSEELKVCGIMNMMKEDSYDFETIENHSTHSQHCTIF